MKHTSMRAIVATLIVSGAILVGAAQARSDATVATRLAAETCASFQNTCAARCKKDNPQDEDCVSDHCSPKLAQCRSTGCWEEGRRYGGKQTCNLRRG